MMIILIAIDPVEFEPFKPNFSVAFAWKRPALYCVSAD
jgi:hypothetical protein